MNEKYNELTQLIEQINDAKLKQKMNALVSDLKNDVAETKVAGLSLSDDDNDVLDQLETAINKLEAEYPEVTTLLNNVMQSLSNLGI